MTKEIKNSSFYDLHISGIGFLNGFYGDAEWKSIHGPSLSDFRMASR